MFLVLYGNKDTCTVLSHLFLGNRFNVTRPLSLKFVTLFTESHFRTAWAVKTALSNNNALETVVPVNMEYPQAVKLLSPGSFPPTSEMHLVSPQVSFIPEQSCGGALSGSGVLYVMLTYRAEMQVVSPHPVLHGAER